MEVSSHTGLTRLEDAPAYRTLKEKGLITSKYWKACFDDIFVGADLKANSSRSNDLCQRCKYGYYCCPVLGCALYGMTHSEFFVPAGSVGLIMNEKQEYLFAQPGMHNIASCFLKHVSTSALPVNDVLQHGNRVILVVEQGFIGLAYDNGQPVLFPPGIHAWTSETLRYRTAISLDQSVVKLGPYTLLTVDEGYAAVTQNNGKQQILEGGNTVVLDHRNWRFEKFLSLKIQSDDLQKIEATSADNINMMVTSTVTWRIADAKLAAKMNAETMSATGGAAPSGIGEIKVDVLTQAIASLTSFMGGVNYSGSFHIAAQAQKATQGGAISHAEAAGPEPEGNGKFVGNALYDVDRMTDAVEHANATTSTYGVQILAINILSAVPMDKELTKALASGAVASAQALQAETVATGNAKAMRIDAYAHAEKAKIEASAQGEAARLIAKGNKEAADLLSTSGVAVDLAKMDKSAQLIGKSDKFFFGQEPAYLANLVLKGTNTPGSSATVFG